jgi:hypothetical protein
MKITLDAAYLQKAKQARRNYHIAILAILGYNDDIIPFPCDLYPVHCRCVVLQHGYK